jgi:hypothetical protein
VGSGEWENAYVQMESGTKTRVMSMESDPPSDMTDLILTMLTMQVLLLH